MIDEAEREERGAASERRLELADAPTWQVRGMRSAPILLATCIALSAAAWAWSVRADVSGRRRGPQHVDGVRGLGLGLPQVLGGLCGQGG